MFESSAAQQSQNLENLINTITTSTSQEDLLLMALSVNQTNDNVSAYVNTSNELPDLLTDPQTTGTMIYIRDNETFVVANGYSWYSIDGRLFRYDGPISKIWSWGCNNTGLLAQGTFTVINKSSPVSIVGGFTDWCQVTSDRFTTVALRSNGTLWSWGDGCFGALGSGYAFDRNSPVSVVGGFTDWCQASIGSYRVAAIRTNGTLWAWGRNIFGGIGDGTVANRSSPVSVVGGFTDWCQISAGAFHTAAIRTNGTLWSWGSNYGGEGGAGDVIDRSSPVSVIGGFTDWCQVSAGYTHTAALRTNGTLWAWGCNSSGQLGDGTVVNKSSPVAVVGGFTDWCQISAGFNHTAAIRTNGTLWTWGYNGSGLLGHNTGSACGRSSPVSVVGGFTDWCQVDAGSINTAAIRTDGTLWVWGFNTGGQIGDGTTVAKSSPVSVVGGFTDWSQVAISCGTFAIRSG